MKKITITKFIVPILSVFIGIASVFGAIIPDSDIHADLEKLFENSPQVSGFPYQRLMAEASRRYQLPLPYVLAVARGESFFDPNAESVKGARGLMQVMPETALDYGISASDLWVPEKNIDVGVHLLSDLYRELQDPYLALAAYYCGCGGVDKSSFTLRNDCDEYVRYIHAHLKRVLASEGGIGGTLTAQSGRLVIANFDNFLDAQRFMKFLSEKISRFEFDYFRTEVRRPDHVRYQYQISLAYEAGADIDGICSELKDSTGFSFCDSTMGNAL